MVVRESDMTSTELNTQEPDKYRLSISVAVRASDMRSTELNI